MSDVRNQLGKLTLGIPKYRQFNADFSLQECWKNWVKKKEKRKEWSGIMYGIITMVDTAVWLFWKLQDWKRSVFIPILKKGNAKERSNYLTIVLISHASKVMLKILQARLQQYVNRELPDFKLDLERQRNQRSNCQHLLDHRKSKRVPEKHLFLLYWLCQSLWLCGSQ